MTSRFRLSEDDCVTIAGIQHVLRSQSADGLSLQRCDAPSVVSSYTHTEFIHLLAAPDVMLSRGHFSVARAARRLHNDKAWVTSLPPKARRVALWRLAWVTAALTAIRDEGMKRTEESIATFRPKLIGQITELECTAQHPTGRRRAGGATEVLQPPCARTLLRWLRRYERLGGTPLALIDKRRSPTSYQRLFCPEAKAIIQQGIARYLVRGGPTASHIVDTTTKDFHDTNEARVRQGKSPLRVPSPNTIRAALKRIDAFEVVAQRQGLEAARRKFGFYERGIAALHPLQRVEVDDWEIDLLTLLGESGALDELDADQRQKLAVGRRWICVAIDCATRVILGFRITDKPATATAIDVVRLITEDKTALAVAAGCLSEWSQHGSPGAICNDQGPTFVSPDYRQAVADLGATMEYPPAGVPKLRSIIERFFGTLAHQLAPTLVGRTFSNAVVRGDYPSEQLATYTDDEIAQLITLFIVDIYHNSPHSGLNGETPANAWKRIEREMGVTPPPDANHRRVVFGLDAVRKIERHGVRIFGIHYTCPQLQSLLLAGHQSEIAVKIDPSDLGHVSVQIGHDWVPAESVTRVAAGMTLEEWKTIARDLRTRFRSEARLSEAVVEAARKRMGRIDIQARALRRLMPLKLSAEEVERAESLLFRGLEIGPEGSAAVRDIDRPGDILGEVIVGAESTNTDIPTGPDHEGGQQTSDIKPTTEWRVDYD